MLLILLLVLSVIFIVITAAKFKMHAFLSLLIVAILFGLLSEMELPTILDSLQKGFGETLGKIGIVIILGTLIGTFLEKSGGAFSMAESILKCIGHKRVPLTMSLVGFVVSIPVFGDSGFIILSPLNKALTKRAGLSLATTAIALVMGLIASHTMVPPTPGPIAAAGILQADLGRVILFGLPISFAVALLGWVFAVRYASRVHIDPDPEHTDEQINSLLKDAPSAPRAFAPIIIPILLIVLKSIAEYPSDPLGTGLLMKLFVFIGHPVIALMIGLGIALTLPKKFDMQMLSGSGWVGHGLQQAAIIIMITGAGGAFGKVLENSGIANIIGKSLAGLSIGLWLPFIVAAAIRAAQGSATVAIITTSSIMAPMAGALGLESENARALMVLAIGAGSFVASHINDSMFWILTQMTNMDVKTGFRLLTFGTILLGFCAAIMIWCVGLFVI